MTSTQGKLMFEDVRQTLFSNWEDDDLADAIFFVKDTWMLSKWSPALSPPSLASQLSVYGFACGGPLYWFAMVQGRVGLVG